MPPVLYKYLSPAAAEAVLANGQLRWSTPATLNDPFDAQIQLPLVIDKAKFRKRAIDKAWELFSSQEDARSDLAIGFRILRAALPSITRVEFEAEMGDAIEEGLARAHLALPDLARKVREICRVSKLLCLSEVPDSSLLWSHYAGSHQGIVLAFSSRAGSVYSLARQIDYVEKLPSFFDEEVLSDIFGEKKLEAVEVLQKHLFTKSVEWAYEREWRLWSGDGRNREAPYEDIPFDPQELVSIILGAHTNPAFVDRIIGAAKKLKSNIEVRRAELGQLKVVIP